MTTGRHEAGAVGRGRRRVRRGGGPAGAEAVARVGRSAPAPPPSAPTTTHARRAPRPPGRPQARPPRALARPPRPRRRPPRRRRQGRRLTDCAPRPRVEGRRHDRSAAPALPGRADRTRRARPRPVRAGLRCPGWLGFEVTSADRAAPSRPRPPCSTPPSWPTSCGAASSSRPTAAASSSSTADGALDARGRRRRRPGLPAVVEQARPGPRDGARRPRPRRRELLALAMRQPLRRGLPPRGRAPHPGRRRPAARRTCRTPPTCPTTSEEHDRWTPRAASRPLAGAELLRQARRDARHLRRSTAGTSRPTATRTTRCSRRWPRPWPSWPASRWRPPRSTAAAPRSWRSRSTGLARAFGRLAAAARGHRTRPGRRRHPQPPGVPRRHPPRRHRPRARHCPALVAKDGAEARVRRRAGRRPRHRAEGRRRRPAGPRRSSSPRCCAGSASTSGRARRARDRPGARPRRAGRRRRRRRASEGRPCGPCCSG